MKVLILGVIRYQPHPTHMHVDAALELVKQVKPDQTYFTHISHLLEHNAVNASLPSYVTLAYDGLVIEL